MSKFKAALAHDAYVIAMNQMKRGTYAGEEGVQSVAKDHLWPRYHLSFTEGTFAAVVAGACEIAEIERDLAHTFN